jgi:hypothetical protein
MIHKDRAVSLPDAITDIELAEDVRSGKRLSEPYHSGH